MKRYFFNLTLNTRDLGGYKTKYSKTTKYLRFIRSDAFRFLKDEDKDFLVKNNFLLSIDFRTEEVINKYPSNLSEDSRFEYYNIPFSEGSQTSLGKKKTYLIYMKMISHYDLFYKIFSLIANTKYNVVFNCTAGKDRTGILACLLLMLAGVSEKDILDDYEVSEKFIEERINDVRNHCSTFPNTLGVSKRENMQIFIALFLTEYGSVENYLLKIGITNKQIETIRNKLIGD